LTARRDSSRTINKKISLKEESIDSLERQLRYSIPEYLLHQVVHLQNTATATATATATVTATATAKDSYN